MAFENNKPHVNFEINKEMDYWTAGEFLTFDPNDIFSNSILITNPKLKDAQKLGDKAKITFYKNYVDQIYKDKESEITSSKNEVQKLWNLIEKRFLDRTQELFNGHIWPEGAYIGFLSIFNCNPRFLNEKTFQVYYVHSEGLVYVCAHEMLHFMFYDYIEKNSALTKNLPESVIWNLSEILNVVILEKPEFAELTGNFYPKPYQKHETQIKKFRELIKNSENIDSFIKKSVRLLF